MQAGRQGFKSPWGRHKKIRGIGARPRYPFFYWSRTSRFVSGATGVQIPLGTPQKNKGYRSKTAVSLFFIDPGHPALQAGRQSRQSCDWGRQSKTKVKQYNSLAFFIYTGRNGVQAIALMFTVRCKANVILLVENYIKLKADGAVKSPICRVAAIFQELGILCVLPPP